MYSKHLKFLIIIDKSFLLQGVGYDVRILGVLCGPGETEPATLNVLPLFDLLRKVFTAVRRAISIRPKVLKMCFV